MARITLTTGRLVKRSLVTLALAFWAAPVVLTPAQAQFGSIFSDPPPRPPQDVPDSRPLPPIDRGPGGQPYYPSRNDANRARADQPPAQPLDTPMSLPPQSRPGGGTIQSQSLPPPPGVAVAPPRGNAQTQGAPQLGTAAPGTTPANVLPGLPPGIRQPPGTPQQANTAPQGGTGQQPPAAAAPPPSDEVVVEPPPQRIANPTAVFSGLDKITGRIISFDVAINETVQFGALQVTPRVCYSRPPTETPNTDAFVEVDEVTLKGEIKRIFSGWMFAASPGLHAVEHPIYDVWLTDCKGNQSPSVADAGPAADGPPRIAVKLPRPRPRIPSSAMVPSLNPALRP